MALNLNNSSQGQAIETLTKAYIYKNVHSH